MVSRLDVFDNGAESNEVSEGQPEQVQVLDQ